MNERRIGPKSVAIKNKLYMIGGSMKPCEVFDFTSNKFVRINPWPTIHFKTMCSPNGVMSIRQGILVFGHDDHVLCYDVVKCNWSEITCDPTKNLTGFCSVKVPKLNFYNQMNDLEGY